MVNPDESDKHNQLVTSHYGVVIWISLRQKKFCRQSFFTDLTYLLSSQATAAGIVETVYKKYLHGVQNFVTISAKTGSENPPSTVSNIHEKNYLSHKQCGKTKYLEKVS